VYVYRRGFDFIFYVYYFYTNFILIDVDNIFVIKTYNNQTNINLNNK